MARRTTLYQRARSPLIQGHSKLESPLWQSWLAGVLFAVLVLALLVAIDPARTAASFELLSYVAGVWPRALAWLVGGALGSLVGVIIGRGWGYRRIWLPGVVLSLLGAVAAAYLVGQVLAQ